MGIFFLKMKGLTLTVVIFICAAGCSLIKAAPEEGVGKLPDKVVIAEEATEEQVENEKEEGDGRTASKRRSSNNCAMSANKQIVDKINYEGARRGKAPFQCDSNLVFIAHAHTNSQATNGGLSRLPSGCNLHSWYGHNKGKDCCYPDDHSNAACVWDKPSEILGGNQPNGYEISHYRSPSASATSAVNGWMNSGGHSAMVLSTNGWDLKKIGCWYTGKFANCWFYA